MARSMRPVGSYDASDAEKRSGCRYFLVHDKTNPVVGVITCGLIVGAFLLVGTFDSEREESEALSFGSPVAPLQGGAPVEVSSTTLTKAAEKVLRRVYATQKIPTTTIPGVIVTPSVTTTQPATPTTTPIVIPTTNPTTVATTIPTTTPTTEPPTTTDPPITLPLP